MSLYTSSQSLSGQGALGIVGDYLNQLNTSIISIQTNLNITGSSTLQSSLTISGSTLLNGTMVNNGSATHNSSLTVSGLTLLNNALFVSGTTTINNTLTVSGLTLLNSTMVNNGSATHNSSLTVSGLTLLNNALFVSGTTTINSTLNVTGNVGIGTTNPSYNLHVIGTSYISNYLAMGNDGFNNIPSSGIIRLIGHYGTGTYLQIQKAGALTWGSTALYDACRYINCTGNAEHVKDFNVGPGGVGIGYAPPIYTKSGTDGLYVNGNVGIGTINPVTKLDVNGEITTTAIRITSALTGSYSLSNPVFSNGQTTLQTYSGSYGGSNFWSIYASARIACSEIWIASDERIKTDINYLSKNDSLLAIRQIKTITYKYIDKIHNGNNMRYGVIAQDVEKYLPDCVVTNNNIKHIPNIFKNHDVYYESDLMYFILDNISAYNIKLPCSIKFITENNKEIIKDIIKIEGNKVFMEDNNNYNKVFIYGSSIDDFKNVNYQDLSIVGINAIQKLDDIVIDQQNTINSMKQDILSLQNLVSSLMLQVQTLLNKNN